MALAGEIEALDTISLAAQAVAARAALSLAPRPLAEREIELANHRNKQRGKGLRRHFRRAVRLSLARRAPAPQRLPSHQEPAPLRGRPPALGACAAGRESVAISARK
jgi:hypothetical protein